ncbi:hypothetical protein SAMD00019534_011550 [Acytostelium subglobosum LB1]|uniref:hypothetical protein n=1 Tax=Acytostelium subglobosum LB1 TaxID=1410327 RepID=UPI00064514EB|nr:hypothetical protein SAMD00019534_011550 [Acytostelium subglobosum LB1]GAM17980.1 hypothetical protein SAMD00019534_011550 [Acytostelium subglobosum LB1]|eukprot:XP_012758576.1 hypothetical protein SAMD00019534_011550 [Acytostelium subglobosum LB1]
MVELSLNSPTLDGQTGASKSPTRPAAIDTEQFNILLQILRALEKVIGLFTPEPSVVQSYATQITAIRHSIDRLKATEKESVTGCFEWIDGLLIKALEQGAWIVIDNANFCNPTVLDRLNPLLEQGGVLMLNERGMVDGEIKVIKPHPNFRIFLTMDERKGEISRAMRNRGIEIYLFEAEMTSSVNLDNARLLGTLGIPSQPLAQQMLAFHAAVVTQYGSTVENPMTISHTLYWGRMVIDLLQRGMALLDALTVSMQQIYIRPRRLVTQRDVITKIFTAHFSYATLNSLIFGNNKSFHALGFFPSGLTDQTMALEAYNLDHLHIQALARVSKEAGMKQAIKDTLEQPAKQLLALPAVILSSVFFQPHNTNVGSMVDLVNKNMDTNLNNNEDVAKLGQYIQHAALYFIETTSQFVKADRMLWLDQQQGSYLGKAQTDMYTQVLKKLFASPLYKRFDIDVTQLLDNIGMSKHVKDYQGHQWKHNESLFNLVKEKASNDPANTSLWASLVDTMDLLKTLLVHILQTYLQERIYTEAAKQGSSTPNKLSPIVQSYLHTKKKLSKESLSSEMITYLYPMFKVLGEQFESWLAAIAENKAQALTQLPVAQLDQLTRLKNNFWRSLNVVQPFQIGEFVIRWRWIIKEVKTIVQAHAALFVLSSGTATVFERINTYLSQTTLFSNNNRLWKQAGHPIVMKTDELVQLEGKFMQLSQLIRFNHNNILESPLQLPVSYLDSQWKRTFVEAISTLHWINYQFYDNGATTNAVPQSQRALENAKSLIPSLVEVQQALQTKLDTLKAANTPPKTDGDDQGSEPAVNINIQFDMSTLRASKAAMWPLLQHYSHTFESSLVAQLSHLLLGHNLDVSKGVVIIGDQLMPTINQLANNLKQYLELCLTANSPVPPASLATYQKLSWMLDGVLEAAKKKQPFTIGIIELQSIFHSVLYNWNASHWNNSYNDLAYLEPVSPDAPPGHITLSSRFDSISLGAGPPRLFQSIQSVFSFYLTHEWHTTTLEDVPAKVQQLQSLIDHLASTRNSSMTIAQTFNNEWAAFRSLLFITIGCFVKCYDTDMQSIILNQIMILQCGDLTMTTDQAITVINQLANNVVTSNNPLLNSHMTKLIVPCLHTLAKRHSSSSSKADNGALLDQMLLGKFALLLSCFRVLWLLPAHPVDPTQKYSVILDYSRELSSQLADEIHVHRVIESQHTGKQTNLFINELTAKQAVIDRQLSIHQKKITLRPTPPAFDELHRDLTQFITQFSQVDKIIDLVSQFELGSSDAQVLYSTEAMWQEKSDNFVSSLEKKFMLYYRDVAVPIATGVMQMKYGLRLVCDASKQLHNMSAGSNIVPHLQQVLTSVCKFPRVSLAADGHLLADPMEMCSLLMGRDTFDGIRTVLQAAAAQSATAHHRSRSNYRVVAILLRSAVSQLFAHVANTQCLTHDVLDSLDMIFRIFIQEYKLQEEERRRVEEEESQTVKFRTKSHKMETLEERDEKVFLSSFPNFYKEFSDLEDIQIVAEYGDIDLNAPSTSEDNGDDSKTNNNNNNQEDDDEDEEEGHVFNQAIKDEEVQQIYLIHRHLFEQLDGISLPRAPSSTSSFNLDDTDRTQLFTLFHECGQLLLNVLEQRAPSNFDQLSIGGHLLSALIVKEKLTESPPSMITYTKLDKKFRFIKMASSLTTHGTGSAGSTSSSSVFATQRNSRVYNIYTDSNIAEISIIREPLLAMQTRVKQLLVEFEDHPILTLLIRLSDRILKCPSSDPLIKIVTGLELLLRKAQEWESFAHKGIMLREPHLNQISRIITRWRKLEIESWPTVFQAQEKEFEIKTLKHWFSLYEIVNDAPQDLADTIATDAHLAKIFTTVQEYLYTATFGDMLTRLGTLRSFDHQLLATVQMNTDDSPYATLLMSYKTRIHNIIHNLYSYFYNFIPQLETKLTQLVAPIEEKAVEFIRLARWEDNKLLTQYERLKQHIEKSHRTLAKLTVKYKNVLAQPVFKIFAEMDSEQLDLAQLQQAAAPATKTKKAAPKGALLATSQIKSIHDWIALKPETFVSDIKQLNKIKTLASMDIGADLQERFKLTPAHQDLYQNKLSILNKRVIDISQSDIFECQAYEMVHLGVESLDTLATDIIERTNELAKDDKVKRKEKSLALHNLITRLTDLGLTYRASQYPQEQLHVNYLFNVDTMSSDALPTLAASHTDNGRVLMEQANTYYYRIAARINQLRLQSLEYNPDLSAREVQKMSGFIEHILALIIGQRNELIDAVSQWTTLSTFVQLFRSSDDISPNQQFVHKWLQLQSSQFNQLVDLMSELTLLASKLANHILPLTDKTTLLEVHSTVSLLKQAVDSDLANGRGLYKFIDHSLPICTQPTQVRLQDNMDQLQVQITKLAALQQSQTTGSSSIVEASINTFIQSSQQLIQRWNEESGQEAQAQEQRVRDPEAIEQFTTVFDTIIKHILLSIQNKKQLSNTIQSQQKVDGQPDTEADDTPIEYDVHDGHVAKLNQLLSKHLSMLHLDTMNQELKKLHQLLVKDNFTSDELRVIRMMMASMQPMMDQYVALANHAVLDILALHKTLSKLEYIMSGVFSQLFTKGFCKKEEQNTEAGGEGTNNFEDDVEGTGMGEGEGKKDVSDEIQDKEQLAGTKDEKKEEKDDDEEDEEPEEKDKDEGFDMEDDFEGDMHDIKKDQKDDDSKENEDDEEELDKEMGDLEKPEDNVVDEKLWGEEDVQDEEEQKEDGQGDETNSDEMMAKDEKEDKKKDQKKDEKQKKEEKKKEEEKEKNQEKGEDQDDQEDDEGEGDEEDFEGQDEDNVTNEENPEEEENHMDPRKEDQFELPEEMDFGENDEGDDAPPEEEDKPEDPLDLDMDNQQQMSDGEDEEKEGDEEEGSDKDDKENGDDEEEQQDLDSDINDNSESTHVEPEADQDEEKEDDDKEGTSLTTDQQDQQDQKDSEQPLGVKDKTGVKSSSANTTTRWTTRRTRMRTQAMTMAQPCQRHPTTPTTPV